MPIVLGSGKITLLGLIVLVCGVFLLGCGGGSDAPPADPASPTEAATEGAVPSEEAPADPTPETEATAEAAAEPAQESPAMEEPAAEGEAETSESAAEGSTPPAEAEKAPEEKPAPAMIAEPAKVVNPRPDDIVAWEDEDFRSAKEDRDPRLLDAVAYLGENSSGDAEAARLLLELLGTQEDPEPEPKPELKVEKKPEKKKAGSEYDQYMGESGPPSSEGDMGGLAEDMGGLTEESEASFAPEMDASMPESTPPYTEGGEGYPGPDRRKGATKMPLAASYVSLTGGIVRALGANGTRESRAVLEQLLAGKVSAGNERAVAGAVLRTLIDYSSPENDALLRKALTSPESFRPNSEKLMATLKQEVGAEPKEGEEKQDVDALVAESLANTVTAEDIRDTTLPLIEQSASMGLRYDLAAYLIGKPSEELGPRLRELVMVTHPLNVQAQIGLYRYANTPEETRDSFERYFTSYASSTLGRILSVATDADAGLEEGLGDSGGLQREGSSASGTGVSEGMETGAMPEADPGPPPAGALEGEGGRAEEMPDIGAQPLEFGGGVGGPGGSGGAYKPPQGPGEADKLSIEKFEEVVVGDPNLPYELARQLWGKELGAAMAAKMDALTDLEEGAQLVMLAGHIPTDMMRAQLLKTLQAHWQEGPEAFASASVASETGVSDPGFITIIKSLPRREPPARAKAEPTEEQSAQYAWMETVYGTVRVFCERFQKAADNAMLDQAAVLEGLPFRTHSTDTVTHAYAADWQKQVGSRLVGAPVDPMRIYYLRFEETGLYSKVLGTYKRAVPKGSERRVKNGLWIDGGKTGPEGQRISMDVIIDRPEYHPDRKATQPEPMVIQVLYVEVNDPNPPKSPSAG